MQYYHHDAKFNAETMFGTLPRPLNACRYREVIDARTVSLGAAHKDTLVVKLNLAALLQV